MAKLTKAYIARLSNDGYVKIDGDEIDKVVSGMHMGAPIVLRNGIINPSYITGIMEDRDRTREWLSECNYGGEEGERARNRGMKPITNIFEGTPIGDRMAEQSRIANSDKAMLE